MNWLRIIVLLSILNLPISAMLVVDDLNDDLVDWLHLIENSFFFGYALPAILLLIAAPFLRFRDSDLRAWGFYCILAFCCLYYWMGFMRLYGGF